MLYAFGFERLGVVASDLYFLDPNPGPGQEGPERGVRMELRFFDRIDQEGSIYASRPIVAGRPVWRVDLLESVDHPGSLDRAHHHPKMTGWEPGSRQFVPELTDDPLGWVSDRLDHGEELVSCAGIDVEELGPHDLEQLRAARGEILDAILRLLQGISAGRLARVPDGAGDRALIRESWL